MTTRTIGLLTFITLVLSGCASEPVVPSVETKRGDRVGRGAVLSFTQQIGVEVARALNPK